MEFHEAAMSFPLLKGKDFEEFVTDIKEHGLQDSIVLLDGKILDGRNRFRACEALGIAPEYIEYCGKQSPEEYVDSKNLYRRHLTSAQRAMNAARARHRFEKAAEARKGKGQKKGASERGKRVGRGRLKQALSSIDDKAYGRRSSSQRTLASEEAGRAAKVSASSVDRARSVLEHGAEELIAMVDQGEVSVATAAQVANKLSKTNQASLIEKGAKAVTAQAAKLRRQKRKPRKNHSAIELIDSIKKDIEKLATFVKEADKGLVAQRERAVRSLQFAKKYVSETIGFFK